MSDPLSPVEYIKDASRLLRGTIRESLADPITGALREDDTQLIKFHGIYQQDDRDLRAERRQQLLEPAYQFMIRARVPAGLCTPEQWLAMDEIARRYANGTLRLTTRQTFQLHGVIKRELKSTIAAINAALLSTLAACGDVNRNVMCTTLPISRRIHLEASAVAQSINDHLMPRTRAYHEIWLDGEQVLSTAEEEEPIYGRHYLPRKFKIVVAIPPDNDVDVFAHDLGYIAIVEAGLLAGFNVTVGGGMGMSHGERATYPRLADVIGFCTPAQAVAVAEAVVTAQRDHGDRTNRKHARLKYTVEDLGVERFRAEVEARAGFRLEAPRAFRFSQTGDRHGWSEDDAGGWHYSVFVESGRVLDAPGWQGLSAMREIARSGIAQFRLTPNQSLVLSDITAADKPRIAECLARLGLTEDRQSPTRRFTLACVGLPTCGLAMADSERYAPQFIDRIDELLARHGLEQEPITIRLTGCPNGCARPFLAEIGLVGKAPGRYNLYIGAAFDGTRLNAPYGDNLTEGEILAALEPLFGRFAAGRHAGEHFGDFLVRTREVPTIESGRDFATAAALAGGYAS